MAPPPPWVILRRRLRLVPEEPDAEHPVAIFGAPREPPRVTVFDVTHQSVHRGPIPADKLPYLVATGPSAFLLGFSDGHAPTVTDSLVLLRNIESPGDAPHQPGTGTSFTETEFVPQRIRPSMPGTYDARSVALTFSKFGGYAIAELHVTNKSSDRAKLLLLVSNDARFFDRLFSSGDDDVDQWTEADLPCPLPTRDREWSPCGVIDHDKHLWWFDLSWGLLSCNPTTMPIVLRFHDLPPGCDVGEPNPFLHTTRCIGVSDNLLRYVDIAGDADGKVVMWTWMHEPVPDGDDSSSSGSGSGSGIADSITIGSGSDVSGLTIGWHKTYEMSFREIWDDASYRNTHLLPMIPEIVLVSPRNPNVVCFFQQTSLFFVDVPAHRVMGVFKDAHELLEAPGHRHCFLPWDLPPSIAKVSHSSVSTSQLRLKFNSLLEKGRRPKSPPYMRPQGYSLPSLASLDLPEFQMNQEMGNTVTTTTTTSSSSSSSSSSDDQSRLDDFAFGSSMGLATDQEEEDYMMEASVCISDDLEAAEIILMHDAQLDNGSHGASREVLVQQRIVFFGKEQGVTSCAVCISDFCTQDRCIRLPCKHIFHVLCIVQWLLGKDTCPVCRRAV